ncbi:type III secretion system inner rod subunit SctI, partial [Salmonella enterica]|uniref:type III secretion system inner rod subunit SctI n=1 Tax=Salmonella enterica TaxID=28901 RepID=UPI001F27FC3B
MSLVPVSTQSYVKSSAEPIQEQINFFEQLLKDESSTSNASALLPQVMFTRQMDYMKLTVGVDYLARISG